MTIRIPDGNAFRIRLTARNLITGEYTEAADLSNIDNLVINYVRRGIRFPHAYTIDEEGRATVADAGSLDCGFYGIELTGYYGGEKFRFYGKDLFEITTDTTDVIDPSNLIDIEITVKLNASGVSKDYVDHAVNGMEASMETMQADLRDEIAEAGKVDDVKVNGVSVVSGKKANITVPTKVSDLTNDSEYQNATQVQQKVDAAKSTSADISVDGGTGTPSGSAGVSGNQLVIALHNIKGEKGDQGDTGATGPQGPQGDSFQPIEDVSGLVLAHTTGQDNTKAMSQKGVTDALTVWTRYNVDLSTYQQKRAFPSPDNWITNSDNYPFYGKFVPITSGCKYYLKANDNAAFNYAFLTTNAYSNFSVVSYATGCTREKVNAGESVTVIAPSDAHYLYILTQTTENTAPDIVSEYVGEDYKDYFKALSQPFKCRWFGAIGTIGATEFPLEIDTTSSKVRTNEFVRISGGNSLTTMMSVDKEIETDFIGEYEEGVTDGYPYALLVAYDKHVGVGNSTPYIFMVRYDEYAGFIATYSDYNIIELGRGVLRNKGKEFVAFGNIIVDGEKHCANPPKIDYGMLSYTSVIGGYLNNNGTITANNTGRGVTEFIPVSKGMDITIVSNGVGIYAASGTYVAYYDAEFSFVSSANVPLPSATSPLLNNFAFTVPDSTSIAYMRLTLANNANPIILNSNDFMDTVQRSYSSAYNVKNTNKSIGVFGGSFSVIAESNYAKRYWKEYLKCSVTNYGEGGAGYSSLQKGLQGHSIQDQVDNAGVHDIYVLWASTNDFTNSREIGAYSDYTAIDNYDESKLVTQCGGINYCIKKLFEKNPKAEIYLFTSLRFFSRDAGYNPFSTDFNSLSKNFADYIEGQKKCCEYYGIPMLDMFNYQGVNIFNYTQYYQNDHIHMNAAGYDKIGRMQAQFLANGK